MGGADLVTNPIGGFIPVWGIVFQFIGAILIFFCYLPGSIQSIRNKQTYSLSMVMWVITIVALACLAIFAWLGFANDIITKESAADFIVVAISETGSLFFSSIIFVIKLFNQFKAKKAGISEEEYCKSLLVAKR